MKEEVREDGGGEKGGGVRGAVARSQSGGGVEERSTKERFCSLKISIDPP